MVSLPGVGELPPPRKLTPDQVKSWADREDRTRIISARPETRKQILSIHLAKRSRDPAQFDLDRLMEVTDGYSGAEIEQGIISALHEAYARKRDLTTEKLVNALANSPPLSVTAAERIAALRKWAKNRCVPAE